MKRENPSILITKYLSNSITALELEQLAAWLEEPANLELFKRYVRINYAIQGLMNNYNTDKAKRALLKKIRADKKVVYRLNFRSYLKYAAIALVFLGLGYFYQHIFSKPQNSVDENFAQDEVVLQLSDGSTEIVSQGNSNRKSSTSYVINGNQLEYKGNTDGSSPIKAYNTLLVPYGKRFRVVLADGSRVDLNSGTSLRYPTTFRKGQKREVFLSGEAYFEVAKDAAHPFVVHANDINVRVLGTHFVMSSYSNDPSINTVLVEGSVALFEKGQEYDEKTSPLLVPGQLASWDRKGKKITFEEVDTSLYTSWVDGTISFSHMPFKEILKKLERHYNVTITNNNTALGEEWFTATFDSETIDQVLRSFKENYPFTFTRENDKIQIN